MIVDGVIFSCAAALAVFIPLRKRYDKRGFFPFSFFFLFFAERIGFGRCSNKGYFPRKEDVFWGGRNIIYSLYFDDGSQIIGSCRETRVIYLFNVYEGVRFMRGLKKNIHPWSKFNSKLSFDYCVIGRKKKNVNRIWKKGKG